MSRFSILIITASIICCSHINAVAANDIHQQATEHIMEESLTQQALEEIRSLHHFFEQWFNAEIPQQQSHFRRFRHAMADDLSFISPTAAQLDKNAIINYLWDAYGQHQNDPIKIWTENESVRPIGGPSWLGLYEEHQQQGEEHTQRISSVIFNIDPKAANAIQWRHVHETWMPPQEHAKP